MKSIKRLWTWYYLLNKRVLKKYSFLLILLLIPLLVKGMQLIAEQESGMLKIVLCQENPSEESSFEMIDALMQDKGILRYIKMESASEAEAEVRAGRADAAWIFAEDMGERIKAYVSGETKKKSLITVIEREDNVALQLSREKLYSAVYPRLSYEIYQNYVKGIDGLEHLTKEQLFEAYERMKVEGSLFQFAYANETIRIEKEPHYLLMPMRGLLSLIIMLCGLAGAMYLMQDESCGRFVWISQKQRIGFSFFYYMPIVVNAALAAGMALLWTRMFLSIKRELILMLLYLVMVIGFCELIRQWTGKLSILGASIPLLILSMLVMCPVFFELRSFRMLQYLLPPFYYLMSLYNDAFIGKGLLYIVGLYSMLFITKIIKEANKFGIANR